MKLIKMKMKQLQQTNTLIKKESKNQEDSIGNSKNNLKKMIRNSKYLHDK